MLCQARRIFLGTVGKTLSVHYLLQSLKERSTINSCSSSSSERRRSNSSSNNNNIVIELAPGHANLAQALLGFAGLAMALGLDVAHS